MLAVVRSSVGMNCQKDSEIGKQPLTTDSTALKPRGQGNRGFYVPRMKNT